MLIGTNKKSQYDFVTILCYDIKYKLIKMIFMVTIVCINYIVLLLEK